MHISCINRLFKNRQRYFNALTSYLIRAYLQIFIEFIRVLELSECLGEAEEVLGQGITRCWQCLRQTMKTKSFTTGINKPSINLLKRRKNALIFFLIQPFRGRLTLMGCSNKLYKYSVNKLKQGLIFYINIHKKSCGYSF